MKRVLLVLAIILILGGCSKKTDPEREKFDKCIEENLSEWVKDYFQLDEKYTLGMGIKVENTSGFTVYVYPLYRNKDIMSYVEVSESSGVMNHAYPSNVGMFIKQLMDTDIKNFGLFMQDGTLYGFAGDTVLNMHTGQTLNRKDFTGKIPEVAKYDKSLRIKPVIPE